MRVIGFFKQAEGEIFTFEIDVSQLTGTGAGATEVSKKGNFGGCVLHGNTKYYVYARYFEVHLNVFPPVLVANLESKVLAPNYHR